MSRIYLVALLAAPLATLVAAPADAQNLLKRLTDRVRHEVERKAEQKLESIAPAIQGASPPTAPSSQSSAQGTPRSKPKRPAEGGSFTSQIAKPDDFAAIYAAYVKFSAMPCDDCEGGIEPAGWPRFPADELSGKYNERALRIGKLAQGAVHSWRVRGAVGALTVIGEKPVNGLRCRQLLYRVTRGQQSAERPGLVCFGREVASSSLETWHEIY